MPNVDKNAASACPQLSCAGFCSVRSQSTLPGSTAVIDSNGACGPRQSTKSGPSMNSRESNGAMTPNETKRSSCGYGKLRNKMRSTTLKTAEVAPTPTANVRIATNANPGFVASMRTAKRKSCSNVSIKGS